MFSTGIKRAYDNACAISGLRIINGGGRAEAQCSRGAVVIAEQLLERLAERRKPSARRDLEAAYSPSKASTQARPSGVMRKRCFLLLGFSGIVIW